MACGGAQVAGEDDHVGTVRGDHYGGSLLETSPPGVFAAGGVRCGSVKRVASAVGEGAMAVQFVHRQLAG